MKTKSEFIALAGSGWAEKRRAGRPAQPFTRPHGAQVALQRCPILRMSKAILAIPVCTFNRGKCKPCPRIIV